MKTVSVRLARPLIFIFHTVFLLTFLPAQSTLWEESIVKGNTARSAGNPAAAEQYYLDALNICRQFPRHDLRLSTTLRNLAQAKMLQLRFLEAGDDYRRALESAQRSLAEEHPYVQQLQSELRQLIQATENSAEYAPPAVISPSWWQVLREQARWIANRSTFQAGPSLPIGSGIGATHEGGLGLGFVFSTPFRLGPLSMVMSVDRFGAAFSPKHADSHEFSATGTVVGIAPVIGKTVVNLGGGLYSTKLESSASQVAFTAAVNYPLVGYLNQPDVFGPTVAIKLQVTQLLATTAAPAATLIRFGIIIGLRH